MVRRVRHGFTLVELLIVIGILLLLLGIGTIGYMHIDRVAAERATRTRLDSCATILSEYETAGVGMTAIESTTSTTSVYNVYTGLQAGSPGDVNVGSSTRTGGPVSMSATVLQTMSHVPAVKSILTAMPASALMAGQSPPIVVDGWKNPIIYVPSGGMTGITLNGVSHWVTSVDGRPFWASAGQDGNFSTGDDNLYSCPVVVH